MTSRDVEGGARHTVHAFEVPSLRGQLAIANRSTILCYGSTAPLVFSSAAHGPALDSTHAVATRGKKVAIGVAHLRQLVSRGLGL